MRKLFTLSLFALLSINTYAQSWLDIGIKGGWGLNFLYNKNMLEDDFTAKFSNGFAVGGKLGWNIDDFHEITLDIMYYQFNQTYKYNVTDSTGKNGPEYTRQISFSGMQFNLLYRHNNDGRYVEIGPSYATAKKVKITDDYLSSIEDLSDLDANMKPYMGVSFGFGGYFIGTENFGVTMGVRFNYAFGDAVKDDGVNNFPAYKTYESYTPTHPLTAMVVMEANLDFAFMAKAKCSNKRKLILF